jgi:hypothetical protein
MKQVIAIGCCLVATTALADCFTRSNIKFSGMELTRGPRDFQRMVVPSPKGSKCILRYRVNIKNSWQTVEGIGYGKTEADACTQAEEPGQGTILEEMEPRKIRAETNMVCSDIPEIRVHSVRIGDVIWESETDLHTHPQEQKYFTYKRTQCRMFVERDAKNVNLFTYQGIICRVDDKPNSKWLVVDKY